MDTLEEKNPSRPDGYTPLHAAARNGQYETCKLILSNIQDKMPKWRGKTPLDLAIEKNHHDISQLF